MAKDPYEEIGAEVDPYMEMGATVAVAPELAGRQQQPWHITQAFQRIGQGIKAGVEDVAAAPTLPEKLLRGAGQVIGNTFNIPAQLASAAVSSIIPENHMPRFFNALSDESIGNMISRTPIPSGESQPGQSPQPQNVGEFSAAHPRATSNIMAGLNIGGLGAPFLKGVGKGVEVAGDVATQMGAKSYGKALLRDVREGTLKKVEGRSPIERQESLKQTVQENDLRALTWKKSIDKTQDAFDKSFDETTRRLDDLSTAKISAGRRVEQVGNMFVAPKSVKPPVKVNPIEVLEGARERIIESQTFKDRPTARSVLDNIINEAKKDAPTNWDTPQTLKAFNKIKSKIRPDFTRGAALNTADAVAEDVQKQLYFTVIDKLAEFDPRLRVLGTQQKNLLTVKQAFEDAAAKAEKKPLGTLGKVTQAMIVSALGIGGVGEAAYHGGLTTGLSAAGLIGAGAAAGEGRLGSAIADVGNMAQATGKLMQKPFDVIPGVVKTEAQKMADNLKFQNRSGAVGGKSSEGLWKDPKTGETKQYFIANAEPVFSRIRKSDPSLPVEVENPVLYEYDPKTNKYREYSDENAGVGSATLSDMKGLYSGHPIGEQTKRVQSFSQGRIKELNPEEIVPLTDENAPLYVGVKNKKIAEILEKIFKGELKPEKTKGRPGSTALKTLGITAGVSGAGLGAGMYLESKNKKNVGNMSTKGK